MFEQKLRKLILGTLIALWIFMWAAQPGFGRQNTNSAQAQKNNAAKSPAAQSSPDPCSLLTSSEMKQVQGEDVVEKKYSEQGGGSFLFRSCFYRTATFSNSISLSLAVPSSSGKDAAGPRDYWMKHFRDHDSSADAGVAEQETRPAKSEEEAERHSKPVEVKGIGEQAYWIGNPRFGILYVLEHNYFLRISLGGKGTNDLRSNKAKELARAVLKRLRHSTNQTALN